MVETAFSSLSLGKGHRVNRNCLAASSVAAGWAQILWPSLELFAVRRIYSALILAQFCASTAGQGSGWIQDKESALQDPASADQAPDGEVRLGLRLHFTSLKCS